MDSWSIIEPEDEYEKLVNGMNPPRVTVDNISSRRATLVKVDSANKQGSLLQVVQVLSDLNLVVRKAYITSDGEWLMDVFHVVDQNGNKIYDADVIDRIQQSLDSSTFQYRSVRRSVEVQSSANHNTIELIGTDRPGLLSEIFAILANQQCNIVASEMWTHNLQMASILIVTDAATGLPIYDTGRLEKIKQILSYVIQGSTDISSDSTHVERRLHQIMYTNCDYDRAGVETGVMRRGVEVTVENCNDRGYTIVNLRCNDRSKLLFDTVCTLTDLQYVIFHATVFTEGSEAYLELYVRHVNGGPASSDSERQRLKLCLEAAIKRRNPEGVRLELCCEDRVGLLAEMTRIFRENGLSVTHVVVTTRDSKAVDTFYVVDASGEEVHTETIEAVRNKIGRTLLHVKEDVVESSTSSQARFSLANLLRSRSEKFFCNLGLIRSS